MSSSTLQQIVAASGITRERVRVVMAEFYASVRQCPELGPIFEAVIHEDGWDAHIEKVTNFWVTTFGMERSYKAREFMPAHLRHKAIKTSHIALWLNLLEVTLQTHCSQPEAAAFRTIAHAMIDNLKIGFARRNSTDNTRRGFGT